MKKLLLIFLLLFIIIIFSIYGLLINSKKEEKALKGYNMEYENYLNKEIYGTELATLINKVTNKNEGNNIKKDENDYFIEDQEDSIKIEIKLLVTEKTYMMEELYNNNISEFVRYFGFEKFKCTNLQYHSKTQKISKMIFEQI